MAGYHGYGRELLYYANNINIKPVELFDYMLSEPTKYPTTNELVNTYVKNYTDIFKLEKDSIYKLMKKNLTIKRLEHLLETDKYLRN